MTTLIDRALQRLHRGHVKGGYTDDEGVGCCFEGALILAMLDEDHEYESSGRFTPHDVFRSDDTPYDQVWSPFLHARQSDRLSEIRETAEQVIAEQFPERRVDSIADFNDHPDTTIGDIEMVLDKTATLLPPEVLGE